MSALVRRWGPNLGIAVIVLYCLAPFYWMVVSSFRRSSDIFDLSALPSPWSLENYRAVFSGSNDFGRALVNSLVVAGVTTAATVVIATLAGFALARLDFRFKNAVLAVVIATSMFPGISLLVPLLKLFTDIGWINTYQSMIVPNLSFALPLAIWYLTMFFRQLPFELEEAARVDGCTPGQAFRKVILPLAVPGVFTTAIIVFVVAWNEFIIALTMVNEPAMQTVTVRISQFVGVAAHDSPFGTRMAAGVVATIPLVIAVLLFQRRIVAGLTSGGLK
ncbi:carbohydrate ABC transporter membrane protein 2 (CUT1 family) [Prauserella shujinwangii]|uniref:Carbohydrate ABC transporter membrane protein 2 (CUT1 family) n=1 Tax=Prauserella shujinwangii TaxID=1453103 RepID=A0A2T0M1G2_9PSEU|nr:carbohydrate ABC transporter permease [Prauserella shujinwangii]PRX50439.1 carbohydrate ABC transporter membrane protein 2 (CUT1 family) [Prauserella shujinwangii]